MTMSKLTVLCFVTLGLSLATPRTFAQEQSPDAAAFREASLGMIIAVATNEAIFNRWVRTCGTPLADSKQRFDSVNLLWQSKNAPMLKMATRLRDVFGERGPLLKGFIDEDVPQIAEAQANAFALANELMGKRYPPAITSWCNQMLVAVGDGRFDIMSRLGPQELEFIRTYTTLK